MSGCGSDLSNQSWKIICVLADQIDTKLSHWLGSEPGISVAGKTKDGKAYEVAIHASYLPWLCFLECEMCFDYDPTAPTREDILVHGIREATNRGYVYFLRNAVDRIRSDCSQGFELCCRDLARSKGLSIPLERALLIHDILVSYSLFGFPISLTSLRNLIHLFGGLSHGILCSLVLIRRGITTLARPSSSLRRTKPTCFNLSRSVTQIRSKLY